MPPVMNAPAATPPSAQQQAQAPSLVVPFTRAAREHVEAINDQSAVLGAAATTLNQIDVPAYGFLRGIWIRVDATGGTGTVAVTQEDAPWSVLGEVSLIDVNGAPVVGPFTGYDLYLIQKYGGYLFNADPKQAYGYSAPSTAGNFAFMLRLPVELSNRDALGSLANQNASSTYKLKITISADTLVFSTQPTTEPTVRVRTYLEAWTQPAGSDLKGNPNATTPPAHGTTSFWSKTTLNIAAGANTPRLPRVGSYIRELIMVFRATSDGTRNTGEANLPDPLNIYYDTRLLKGYPQQLWRDYIRQRTGYTAALEAAGGLDKGVSVEDYIHDFDGQIGHEMRDGYLPTVQSTRLELNGSWGVAGTLTVLTNDVSPVGEIFI